MKRKTNNWVFAIILTLPVVLFFLGYLFNHSPDLIPTGFIQYDNVAYIAYARQYLDSNSFHIFYSNPFDIQAPSIYFQPQTVFFAFILFLGVPPGAILIPFTILCSLICFRLVIRIYDFLVVQNPFRKFHILLFAWGGGLLAISGGIGSLFLYPGEPVLSHLFFLDPESGWWGLNFGRSLMFSCEAYYHALFLGIIYSILIRRWSLALILIFLLSISHPFTGIEIIGIVCLWMVWEVVINRKNIPLFFAGFSILLLAFHLFYYLFYLEQFAHHRSVSSQYSLTWGLRYYRMLPAYALVGALAIASIYLSTVRNFLASRTNRLFICWFLVAFLLANHDMFMKARQPIHFTRGYIWTSLFLLGLPALNQLTQYLKSTWKGVALALFGCIFLLDNILWIGTHIFYTAKTAHANYITKSQQTVLSQIHKASTDSTLIISNDEIAGYLSTVYTSAYPFYSHPYTTPFAREKKYADSVFKSTGELHPHWMKGDILFVVKKTDSVSLRNWNIASLAALIKISENGEYIIYRYPLPKMKMDE